MPTPFNHLLAAHDLRDAILTREVRQALAEPEVWSAFLLGNIAPDVQTISGQTREATHFFPVPMGQAPPAHETLLAQHLTLRRSFEMLASRAAFVAGYLAHLMFDQFWIGEIFEPIFGPEQTWATFRERLYLHNALRAYWDANDLAQLPAPTGGELRAAAPSSWLPFVTDEHLRAWRNLIADQLYPDQPIRTVEVFAERMKVDAQAFAALISSPAEMQRRVFDRVPSERLAHYRAQALARSARLIEAYWMDVAPPVYSLVEITRQEKQT